MAAIDEEKRHVRPSFCRFCHAFCGISVTVAGGRVTKVIGDVENPMYEGFSCVKGRALPEQHNHPDRLLTSLRRGTDGRHVPIASALAMDDIARRLSSIIEESGPRSVALYCGTFAFHYPVGNELGKAFMRAIGSRMRFSSGSIDQPGKFVAKALHGSWSAGPQPFAEADTWMLIGANPTVSMWGGIPQYNPAKRLREALARGMKLIVIDPRRTEVAAVADLHLQPKPGEDPTILAGIIRVILDEGLHDSAFVADEVTGIDELRAAVAPFTPEYVERRANVAAADVGRAARLFASGRSGSVTAGTGPNMAPRGTLTEYLVASLQTLCGRWLRAGEAVPNPFVLKGQRLARAQADAPIAASGYGEQLRVRGLGDNVGGLPTAALSDEILLEGPGKVRALICLGGNPMAAWPDQLKTYRAIQALDLLVTLDPRMSATAKLAHYVIAPKLSLEVDGITMPNEKVWGYGAATTGYPEPYAQFAPALVDPPVGSDLVEEWEFFYGVAQRMGLQLSASEVPLDMQSPPTTDDLHQIMTRAARIPLDIVKQFPHGHVFSDPSIVVIQKQAGWPYRLDVGHRSMMQELGDVAGEPIAAHAGYADDAVFSYRLISRRMLDVYNSSGRDIPHLTRRYPYNPAFMHPNDLQRDGIADGDVIEIDSGHARILGVVAAAPDLVQGAISMAHGWGDSPEHDADLLTIGSNTGRLTDNANHFDAVTGLPRMSAIPVNVRRVPTMARNVRCEEV